MVFKYLIFLFLMLCCGAGPLFAGQANSQADSIHKSFLSKIASNIEFSEEELRWLNLHKNLRVGYLENYLPYSDTKDGDVYGVVKELMPAMGNVLGFDADSAFVFEGFRSSGEMLSMLARGELDLVFPVGDYLQVNNSYGVISSDPVITSMVNLIYKGEVKNKDKAVFAVNVNNNMQHYDVVELFPSAKVMFYASIEECLQAVLDGEADYTTLNGLRANGILKNRKYRKLNFLQMVHADNRRFGIRAGDIGLQKLVNRSLDSLGPNYALASSYNYLDDLHKRTFVEFVIENSVIIFLALGSIGCIVIIFMIIDNRRRHGYLKKEEQKNYELQKAQVEQNLRMQEIHKLNTDLNNRMEIIQSMSKIYFVAYYVNAEENTFEEIMSTDDSRELVGTTGVFSDAVNRIVDKFLMPEYVEMIRELADISTINERLADREVITYEYKSWREVWDEADIIAGDRDENGRLKHFFYAVRSINEEKTREEEQKKNLADALDAAERANQAKTMFLNSMSHDIRTPMNAIIGLTSLAMAHIDNREQMKDYLGKITVSSEHLLSLINDVLDMSRIESGNLKIEEKNVHIPDIFRDLRTIIQGSIASKRLKLIIDAQDIVHENIISDKLRLNQVLFNIVSNAIKFTPAGGRIEIHLFEKPCAREGYASLELHIKDSGIGMSEEFKEHVFESFTRAQTSTVSGIQGTGLGMAITKNIVEMMGGTIEVFSEEDKGTEFIVKFDSKIALDTEPPAPIPEMQGARAFVVDDNLDTCTLASKMLRQLGMICDWATSGKEALVRVQEACDNNEQFKAIFIDWLMPDVSGIETARRMRKIVGDDVRIIIISSYDWSDIEEEAKSAGVTNFVAKPLFISEIHKALSSQVESKKVDNFEELFENKRILLVEDNPLNQEIALTLLEESGFEIEVANNGAIAIEKISDAQPGKFDAVLMDVQMPVMDGYEATRAIRMMSDPKKARLPIIAMTANAFEEDRSLAKEAGMDAHIAKPIDIPVLMQTLADVFSGNIQRSET